MDRLDEFRTLSGYSYHGMSDDEKSFVIVARYDIFNIEINKIKNTVERLVQVQESERSVVTSKSLPRSYDAIMRDVTYCNMVAMNSSNKIRKILDDIKLDDKRAYSQTSSVRDIDIRANLMQKALRKFASVMNMYNQTSRDVLRYLKDRDDRIRKMIASPDEETKTSEGATSGEQAVQNYLISEEIDNTVIEMQDRHERIKKLEQTVTEVYQLFQDLSMIVEDQGETLDVIEVRIQSAKDSTIAANEQLEKAEKSQNKSRKRTCCILVTVLATIALISIPILSKNVF